MDRRSLTTKNQPSVVTNKLKVRIKTKIKKIWLSKLIGCIARSYLNSWNAENSQYTEAAEKYHKMHKENERMTLTGSLVIKYHSAMALVPSSTRFGWWEDD